MVVKELKEYLSRWPEDEHIHFLAVKPKDRIVWPSDQIEVIVITDSEVPVIGLELGEAMSMDEELIRAAEADEAAAGWISVDEQLPKPYTNVLVTIKHSEWISDWDSTWVPVEEQRYHEATTDVTMAHLMCDGWEFFDEDSWSMCDEEFGDDRGKVYDVVVAWMPLPEQYRAD